MLDGHIRQVIEPGLDRMGQWLASRGVDADTITLVGLALGLFSALLVVIGASGVVVLVPMLVSRLMDGLDGAVARATAKTDFGGLLDIACDFLFYGAIPLAFIWRDVDANAAAGAFLLASFYVNGTTFLGYAVVAERNGMDTRARGEKSLYFTAGLMEGSETILIFALMILFPSFFAPLAWIFGVLCCVTALARMVMAWRVFQE